MNTGRQLGMVLAVWMLTTYNSAEAQEYKRFEIGIHASGNYSFRNLKTTSQNSGVKFTYEFEKVSLLPEMGISIGWNIYPRFRLLTGINYALRGFRSFYFPECAMGGEFYTLDFKYHSTQIEIPLAIDVFVLPAGKKHNFFVRGGSFISIRQNAWVQTVKTYSDRREVSNMTDDTEATNWFGWSGALGYRWRMAHNLALQTYTTYQRAITPEDGGESTIDSYPWSAGLAIEINYLF